jgi:hypothetical protein
VGSKIRSVAYWLCRPLSYRATGQPVASSLPNVAPVGCPDESCSVEIGLHRFAAAYEDVGAFEEYVVEQAWARWWWVWVRVVDVVVDGVGGF